MQTAGRTIQTIKRNGYVVEVASDATYFTIRNDAGLAIGTMFRPYRRDVNWYVFNIQGNEVARSVIGPTTVLWLAKGKLH